MYKLIVLVGIPYSGKSTAAASLTHPNVFIYSTDAYIEAYAAKKGRTYAQVFNAYFDEARKKADADLKKAIASGKHVVWDQTNMSAKKRKSIIAKLPSHYEAECLCIQPPNTEAQWSELYKRAESRTSKVVPTYVLKNMADAYEQPDVSEGFKRITITDLYGNIIKVRQ